jgi:hypothetical protein
MDNCGVNKGYLMCAFAISLVTLGIFDQVHLDWLVAGHTKFTPDRMFGSLSWVELSP